MTGSGEDGVSRYRRERALWSRVVPPATGPALVLAVLVTVIAGTTGCGRATANPDRAGQAEPTKWPAGIAGGACQLLDYDVVTRIVGPTFDVSAAADQGDTNTCVLQQEGSSFPDLTLAVSPTSADVTVFKSTVQPKNATAVAALGRTAYSRTVPASGGAGPGVEVGWLSGNGRLILLRYRCTPGTSAEDVAALLSKIVELGKDIDRSSV